MWKDYQEYVVGLRYVTVPLALTSEIQTPHSRRSIDSEPEGKKFKSADDVTDK